MSLPLVSHADQNPLAMPPSPRIRSVTGVVSTAPHHLHNRLRNSTSKASGKLKILPEEPGSNAVSATKHAGGSEEESSSSEDEEGDRKEEARQRKEARDEVYRKLEHIPEGSMRRDARRLTRKGRASLPRVTAYSTAT